jgi:hypothetical protein
LIGYGVWVEDWEGAVLGYFKALSCIPLEGLAKAMKHIQLGI